MVAGREVGSTTKEAYSAIEDAIKELYLLIQSVFCGEGVFVINI